MRRSLQLIIGFVIFPLILIAQPSSANALDCTSSEVLSGEWCIYTGPDKIPDKIIHGFIDIYHASVWWRNGNWHMVMGGWIDSPLNDFHDKVFRMQTSDIYGITGWQTVPGYKGEVFYIDNTFENSSSNDFPSDVKVDREGNPVIPHKSWHTIQPHMFPFEQYPPKPDGSRWDCCDILTYSYDYEGRFPEVHAGIHYAFVDSNGTIHRAGPTGDKNPLINWRSYDSLGPPTVNATTDGRMVYDPKTKKFYLVYVEWYSNTAYISLAVSNWANKRFSVVKRNLLQVANQVKLNPQIVISPDGKYHLYYTTFSHGIHAAVSDDIAGPYVNQRLVLNTSSSLPQVGTPFVFCNHHLNVWQMYFDSRSGSQATDNQIYTAFLRKPCSQTPALSPTFTMGDLSQAIGLYGEADDRAYQPRDNLVNSLDIGYVINFVGRKL